MAIYPEAVVKLVDRYKPGGSANADMSAYRRFQAHTAVSNGSLFNWFNQPGHAVSHFYILADGTVEQYIDTRFRSSATLNGNPDSITVETEDIGAPFPVWSGENVPAWTDAQVFAFAKLGAWAHRTHNIPVKPCPNSLPGSTGFSWHRQGIDPWRVAGGEVWSRASGKVCPGDRRVSQWNNDVIPLTAEILSGGSVEEMEWTDSVKTDSWGVGGEVFGEKSSVGGVLTYAGGYARKSWLDTQAIRAEQLAAKLREEAILAAVKGSDASEILARIEAYAEEERQRDTALMAAVQAIVAEPGASAEDIVRRIGELLSAPSGA